MIRRATTVVLGLVVAVTGALATDHLPAADAQFADRLDLVAQTVFVTAEPVVVDLRVPRLLDERQLRVRVHPPITDGRLLAAAFTDPPANDAISLFTVDDLHDLTVGAGDIISVTLPDEEIGEILRASPGVLPVVIELLDAERVIDTLVTGVIVDDETRGATIDFGFVADARSALAHRPDGSLDLDPASVLRRVETAVAGAPKATLVQFNPETLTALADTRTDDGLLTLDAVRRLLEDHHLDTRPWVDLDAEAWRRAGEDARVFTQYAAGADTVEIYLGRSPRPVARMGPTAGPETLELFRGVGITAGIVEPDRLTGTDLARADRRPLQVRDSNGVAFTVLPVDRAFGASLSGPDPELVALRLFLELVLDARAADTDRGIVLDLDTVDRIGLEALLQLSERTHRIGTTTVERLLEAPPARDASGAVLRVELLADEPADVSGGASDIRLTESALASFVGMVDPADGTVDQLRSLLTTAMAAGLDDQERRAYTDAVFATVVDGTAGFAVLESERVTLATHRADLPVVIHNDQPFAATVIVRLTSEKLRLPGGDELVLTLPPGDTTLDIPVESIGSGDARLLVQITSPDGVLDLASGAVNVRSTAISGFGLVVSLLSLTVLLTWWARTIWRVRGTRRAASVAETPAIDPASETSSEAPANEDPPS